MKMQIESPFSIGEKVWACIGDEVLVNEEIVEIELDLEKVLWYKLNGLSNRFLAKELFSSSAKAIKSVKEPKPKPKKKAVRKSTRKKKEA